MSASERAHRGFTIQVRATPGRARTWSAVASVASSDAGAIALEQPAMSAVGEAAAIARAHDMARWGIDAALLVATLPTPVGALQRVLLEQAALGLRVEALTVGIDTFDAIARELSVPRSVPLSARMALGRVTIRPSGTLERAHGLLVASGPAGRTSIPIILGPSEG